MYLHTYVYMSKLGLQHLDCPIEKKVRYIKGSIIDREGKIFPK